MRQIFRQLWWVAALAALTAPAAVADSLYRWFDERGQAHFSDQPPVQSAERAERLPRPSYAVPERPADEAPYSILNQLRRLEASRERLARERREQQQRDREFLLRQRELEALERPPPAPAVGAVLAYPRPHHRPPPAYGPSWPTPPQRPPSLWQPDHPAYRPYPPSRPPRAVHGRVEIEAAR
jgi:hypothetical protein